MTSNTHQSKPWLTKPAGVFVQMLGGVLLHGGVVLAAEPCAWVLWFASVESVPSRGPEQRDKRWVWIVDTYPGDRYTQCTEDAHAHGAKALKNLQDIEEFITVIDEISRAKHMILAGLRGGRTYTITHQCLPHPLKPE